MKRMLTKRYSLVVLGTVLLLVISHALILNRSQSDPDTARAVASLLARSSVSDRALSTAMKIPGVRDAYVVREDGFIGLPARRRGYAAHLGGEASAVVSLNNGERIVVEAYRKSQASQVPVFLILPLIAVFALLVTRKRSTPQGEDREDEIVDGVRSSKVIDIDLASHAADAALITVDAGCRVIAASERARKICGVSQSSGHIVDILKPDEVQNVLQLVRRCEREKFVKKTVSWRGGDLQLAVLKNAHGFLLKLWKEIGDEE